MYTMTVERPIARDFFLVLLASGTICLFGQISIPLWFTPIPLATQNAVILLLALLLGARRAGAATLLFLVQGAVGLPVFAGGLGGIAHFAGPRGGYLLGYLVASLLVGAMSDRGKSPLKALALGNLVIYICGASYLAAFVGPLQAVLLGIAPFIFGDVLKLAATLKILPKYERIRRTWQ